MASDSTPRGVPVVPNAAVVHGTVRARRSAEDGDVISIEVTRTDDVAGLPNFAADEVGNLIEVFAAEAAPDLHDGDEARATVALRADERGGRYVATGRFERT